MAGSFTDQGRVNILDYYFRGATLPTLYYMALITNAVAADNNTTTLGALTQISDGGYSSGGNALTPATEFDALVEGSGVADIEVTDQQWEATTSIAPAQGVITDDNVTEGSREVLMYFATSGTASAGQTYTVVDTHFDFNQNSGQWTDKGMYEIFHKCFDGGTMPTNLYVALIRASSAPTTATNTLSELTQISGSTGYTTNGTSLNRNSTDFDSLVDGTNQGELQIKDVAWTASGGDLDSGAGARYVVLTDDNATPGNRIILCWWDLTTDRNVTNGNTLTLQNLQINFTT